MDNGLTPVQASEVMTHVAFCEGWPNAFFGGTGAKAVFESRRGVTAPTDTSSRR
jgi:4-carboxymuconolactone decarboxylase